MESEMIVVDNFKDEISTLVKKATVLEIISNADNESAAQIMNDLNSAKKRAEEILEPSAKAKKAATEAHTSLKLMILSPIEAAREIIRRKIGAFSIQETLRREAIAKEAQAKADAEAKKLARKITQNRTQPNMPITAPIITAAPVKIYGASVVDKYSIKVVDFMKLTRAVASGKGPVDAVLPNESWLNATARNRKTVGELLPGVICRREMIAKSTGR